MVSFPTSPEELIDIAQSLVSDLWNAILDSIWSTVSSALSPLSLLGKIGLLLGLGALTLIGIQSYRQGYEGRISQPASLMGFGSALLVIADFLPPEVLQGVLAFVGIGVIVSVYNLKSYFAGNTESSEWYDFYRRLFGSLTLAILLFVLVLKYVVGVNLPLLP